MRKISWELVSGFAIPVCRLVILIGNLPKIGRKDMISICCYTTNPRHGFIRGRPLPSMDELTTNISSDRFVDMPGFYGSVAAGNRLAMVKDREDFLD